MAYHRPTLFSIRHREVDVQGFIGHHLLYLFGRHVVRPNVSDVAVVPLEAQGSVHNSLYKPRLAQRAAGLRFRVWSHLLFRYRRFRKPRDNQAG